MASVPYKDRKFDKTNKQAYDNKYMADNYDRIVTLCPKGYKEKIKKLADIQGISMGEWVRNLIENAIND